jgi:hypothetical protein
VPLLLPFPVVLPLVSLLSMLLPLYLLVQYLIGQYGDLFCAKRLQIQLSWKFLVLIEYFILYLVQTNTPYKTKVISPEIANQYISHVTRFLHEN